MKGPAALHGGQSPRWRSANAISLLQRAIRKALLEPQAPDRTLPLMSMLCSQPVLRRPFRGAWGLTLARFNLSAGALGCQHKPLAGVAIAFQGLERGLQ